MSVVQQQPEDDGHAPTSIEIESLIEAVKDLRGSLRKSRLFGVATAICLALNVALTIVLAAVIVGQVDTNHRVQEAQRQEAQVSGEVLCPLYATSLAQQASPDAKAQQAAMTPSQRAQYETALAVVKRGYVVLGCQPPLPKP